MNNLKKVIDGLKCHINEAPYDCPYGQNPDYPCSNPDCEDQLLKDALAILIEQEPVKAIKMQQKKYIGRTGISFDGSCGSCGTYLMRGWIACPICGKKVYWK